MNYYIIKTFESKKVSPLWITSALLFVYSFSGMAQPSLSGMEHLFTTPENYVACYAPEGPVIDGNISDLVWSNAAWSNDFRDIEGELKPAPLHKTRMKMLWNDTHLFIAAEMEEPHVWAYLKNHDDVVYYDNDFEVFIDPNNDTHGYFEIEINALNTIFDLFMPKPYRNGSGALISWDTPGLQTAVNIQGSLNNPDDIDKGWTVEMAIPFAAITIGNNPDVPKDGRIMRIGFSRVEWQTEVVDGKYVKKKDSSGKTLPEYNWVWSPQGVINMHCPERWGYLQFSKQTHYSNAPAFVLPYGEKQRQYLWLVYYRQKEFLQKNKKYASSLSELGIKQATFEIDGKSNKLTIDATDRQFRASIQSDNARASINDEGLVGN